MINQITYKLFIVTLLIINPVKSSSSCPTVLLDLNESTNQSHKDTVVQVNLIDSTIRLKDVIEVEYYDYGLDNKIDISTFIKYIKTQSNRLNTLNEEKDVYFVMQTILNRCKHKKCTWREYYNSPRLNQSNSIKKMRNGRLRKSFNSNDKRDKILLKMLSQCKLGTMDDVFRIESDKVLFFHSYSDAYDKPPHSKDKFYIKARHKFYTK